MPSVGLAAGDVWHVGPTGDFQTLTDVLAIVSSGDRVLVEPGTYNDCPAVSGIAVDIVAPGGPAQTTIQCSDPTRAYAVEITAGAEVRLDGFTVVHGSGLGGVHIDASDALLRSVVMDGMTNAAGAGCVDASNGSAYLFDVSLARCYGASGGAVRAINSSLILVEVDITQTDAAGSGGAVYHSGGLGGILRVAHLTIDDATAGGSGGAMYLANGGTLRDVHISNSSALAYGGGVWSGSNLALVDSSFVGNNAGSSGGEGGGAWIQTGTLTSFRTSFRANSAYWLGGGIAGYGTMTVTASEFENNTASTQYGGAIGSHSALLTTRSSTFDGNTAPSVGGAIYAPGGWSSSGDEFRNNVSTASVGGAAYAQFVRIRDGVFEQNTAVNGGALYLYSADASNIEIQGTRFAENTATNHGGAIYVVGGTPQQIQYSEFFDNQASYGGAISVISATMLTVEQSRFVNNTATTAGGAVYWAAGGTTTSHGINTYWTLYEGNHSDGNGGAIYFENAGYMYAARSWFVRNSASQKGGGLFTSSAGTFEIDYSVLCANTATGDGGAVYGQLVPGGNYFYYTAFQQNSASRGPAYFEDGRATSATGRTFIYGATVAGNTSGTVGYEGFVGLNAPSAGGYPARISVERSVLQSNGAPNTGNIPIRSLNTSTVAPYPLRVYYSDFYGHSTAVGGPILFSSSSGLADSSGNNSQPAPPGTVAPPIALAGWTVDANCYDDDLTGTWTFYEPNGASIDSVMYGDPDADGLAFASLDCEPGNPSIRTGLTETLGNSLDEDCYLGADFDTDGDGAYDTTRFGADCAENDASINPWAADIVGNGTDEDCSGADLVDGDGDTAPWNFDCDDADPLMVTGMAEIPYDGVDRNCADDDYDADGDGYDGTAFGGVDCNDSRDEFSPDAIDMPYDGIDHNCDGHSDYDADYDGYDGTAWGGTDCDDSDPGVGPGVPEIPYDGFDQNCDQWNDYDGDEDGFVPTAYNAYAGGTSVGLDDCDDANPFTFPGAVEISDGEDNTCDGIVNPDPDFDGDGVLDNWEITFGTLPDDPDYDDDGLSDGQEWGPDEQHPWDTDSDGFLDANDADSDNDSLPDAYEGWSDYDEDGTPGCRDFDDDGDNISTWVETDGLGPDGAPDTDGDGMADWYDDDSDDDGALDVTEGAGDPDGDGIGAWRDSGANGTGPDPTAPVYCGCTSAAAPSLGPLWALGVAFLAMRRRRPAR